MDLYLVELSVADWSASVTWYRDRLGLRVELLDEPNRYALLAGGAGRFALKAGTPTPGGTKLVFHVADLDAELARVGVLPVGQIRVSAEGYRSARLADPDGRCIELFEWAATGPGRLH